MDFTETDYDRLCLKLRFKVVYHLGQHCADVDDVVQESLARFFRIGQLQMIGDNEELGAYLNLVCRNVILEYRQKMGHMESASRPFRGFSATV
jgi:DNA-directed RNA polymerase specialized sigma24 family protein